MSKHWTRFNVMTERWEFLYVRRSYVEVFEKAWALHKESKGVADAKQPSGNAKQDSKRDFGAANTKKPDKPEKADHKVQKKMAWRSLGL